MSEVMAELSDTETAAPKGASLSRTLLRRVVVTLAASAATAATAYLTRKSSELWEEKVLPKIREKGGGQAVAKEALDTVSQKLNDVSDKIGGRGSGALAALEERLGTEGASSTSPESPPGQELSDDQREKERRERRRRRQERQRSLKSSGSS